MPSLLTRTHEVLVSFESPSQPAQEEKKVNNERIIAIGYLILRRFFHSSTTKLNKIKRPKSITINKAKIKKLKE